MKLKVYFVSQNTSSPALAAISLVSSSADKTVAGTVLGLWIEMKRGGMENMGLPTQAKFY